MGNKFSTQNSSAGDQHAPPQLGAAAGEGFTCEICIEPVERVNQTFTPKNGNCAAHRFCNDCMIKYIGAKLDDNNPRIPCPSPTCPEFLDPLEYRVLVGPALFVRWCDALCELALVGVEQCYCPNRTCSALVLNECGAAVKKAACPSCKRAFCFQCKIPWHAGFRCEESGQLRDRNDRAFGALVEQRMWRRCPQCHHFVELTEGCHIVTCRCATTFCYRCGAKFNGVGCECSRIGGRGLILIILICLIVLQFAVLLVLTTTSHSN